MDWQLFFNIGGSVATLLVGGYIKFVQSQLSQAKADQAAQAKELSEFKIKVAENYITHQDLRRIEDALVRIEAKIEVKADK